MGTLPSTNKDGGQNERKKRKGRKRKEACSA
jgi:hypothetical protein